MSPTKNTPFSYSRLPDPPRAVKTSALAVQGRLILWPIMLSLVFGMMWLAGQAIQEEQRFEHGVRVTGTVVDKYTFHEDGHDTMHYRLEVKFPAKSDLLTERVRADSDEYDRYPIGSPAVVTYLPEEPSECRLGVMTQAIIVREDVSLIGAILLSCSILLLAPGLIEYSIRKQKRLLQFGRVAPGIVDQIKEGRKKRVTMTYHFDIDGRQWTGVTYYSAQQPCPSRPGESITVFYLPNNPKVSSASSGIRLAALRSGAPFV